MRRTTCKNRHLGAAAVAVAADAALAETSIELPPANNPANALIMRRTTCKYLPIDASAALADAGLDVPATDNNADAAADASLAGVVASMVPPPWIIMLMM